MSLGEQKTQRNGRSEKRKGKGKRRLGRSCQPMEECVVGRKCCLEGTTANFLKLKIGDPTCVPVSQRDCPLLKQTNAMLNEFDYLSRSLNKLISFYISSLLILLFEYTMTCILYSVQNETTYGWLRIEYRVCIGCFEKNKAKPHTPHKHGL